MRNLARLGRNIVSPFWAVLGFGRASAGPGQHTPRNLLGFKDGTRNIATDGEYAKFVWVNNSDQPWMNGDIPSRPQDPDADGDVGCRPDR